MRTLLHGGSVIDGTGRPPFAADIWIEHGRIASLETLAGQADVTIDCAGLTVAPGFIDGYSHSDLRGIHCVLRDGQFTVRSEPDTL